MYVLCCTKIYLNFCNSFVILTEHIYLTLYCMHVVRLHVHVQGTHRKQKDLVMSYNERLALAPRSKRLEATL